MSLLIVHYVSCYLWIVVLLRRQIFCVECFLGQCLPKIMFVCLYKQYLCAHRAQPVDTLWACATLGLIDDTRQAGVLLFSQPCLLCGLSINSELGSLVDSHWAVFLWSWRGYDLIVIEEYCVRVRWRMLNTELLIRGWQACRSTSEGYSAT